MDSGATGNGCISEFIVPLKRRKLNNNVMFLCLHRYEVKRELNFLEHKITMVKEQIAIHERGHYDYPLPIYVKEMLNLSDREELDYHM